MALTACDLNSLMGGNNGGGNNAANEGGTSRAPINLNDTAIKIADMFSIFPEVGDDLNLDDYVDFDTGSDYKLQDFTFESLNPDVISINNYHASCIKQGYAAIKISGPGLNTPVELSLYVGSIAGHYVPDSRALNGVVDLNVVQGENGYSFALNVVSNGKNFNNRPIVSSSSAGTLVKNITPFLPFVFDGAAPSSFSPITNFITDIVPEAEDIKDLGEDVYGFMSADSDAGVILKMRFNEYFIDLTIA